MNLHKMGKSSTPARLDSKTLSPNLVNVPLHDSALNEITGEDEFDILNNLQNHPKWFLVYQGFNPRRFLVFPTNKSPDLIMPGMQPLTVTNGNWAIPSFLPSETSAISKPGLYVAILLSFRPLNNSFRFSAVTSACLCAKYPCLISCFNRLFLLV